jgi:putative oxidoreductase
VLKASRSNATSSPIQVFSEMYKNQDRILHPPRSYSFDGGKSCSARIVNLKRLVIIFGMKVVTIIVRMLLGLMFVVFGSNIFFHFIPMPEPKPSLATDFSMALMKSGYMYVIGGLQVAGGLLLLIGRYVPLGLTLLGPVIVNILLFHIFLERTGLPMAIVVSVLALFLLWRYRSNFAGLVKA